LFSQKEDKFFFEFRDPVPEEELVLLLGALVGELDLDPGVQERELPQALGEDLVLELPGRQEDLGIGLEGDLRAGLSGVADHDHLLRRLALGEAHLVDLPPAPHLGLEPLRHRVHALGADAVQAPGDLVRPLPELAARVQVGEHELEGRYLVHGMRVHRDAAAVVLDRARPVEVDGDLYDRGEPGQGLVDGVVDHLKYAVVEAALIGVANVHVRALAHPLQALEFLDL
jgi:hypothetical protein